MQSQVNGATQTLNTRKSQLIKNLKLKVNKLVTKIYRVLSEGEKTGSFDCAEWNSNGNGFTINDVSEFAKLVSDNSMRLNEKSLVKKLGLLKFRGQGRAKEGFEFRHPFFKRDGYKDLHLVKKVGCTKKIRKIGHVEVEIKTPRPEISTLRDQITSLSTAINTIISNNNSLVATNSLLISQLSMLKSQCDMKMTDVLKMLINTVGSSENPFAALFGRIMQDFNVNPNLNLSNEFVENNEINYFKFFQTATNNSVSPFTLFERMNSTYNAFKTHLLTSVAKKTVESLNTYCSVETQHTSTNLCSSTVDLSLNQVATPKSVNFKLDVSQRLKSNQKSTKTYAKDDIDIEDIRHTSKYEEADGHQNVEDNMSLSEYSYMAHSHFAEEDM